MIELNKTFRWHFDLESSYTGRNRISQYTRKDLVFFCCGQKTLSTEQTNDKKRLTCSIRLSALRANDSRLAGFVGGIEDGSGGVDMLKHFLCYLKCFQSKLLIVLFCARVCLPCRAPSVFRAIFHRLLNFVWLNWIMCAYTTEFWSQIQRTDRIKRSFQWKRAFRMRNTS